MGNLKQKLIEQFGVCVAKRAEALDKNRLFMKSGISVIAALAGMGKTTKMLELSKDFEEKGYTVSYINFDSSINYNNNLIDCPTSSDTIKLMYSMILSYANSNDIIVIDSLKSLASYYSMTIENNDEMYLFMLELRTIVKKTNCSIILVHHVYRPKNLKNSIDSFYGARAIEEQSDSAFMFYRDSVIIVKSRLGYTRDEQIYI